MNFLHIALLVLERFVDDCPWTSIVHGQLSMLHGHCLCYMDIVHVIFTLSILYGQCKKMNTKYTNIGELSFFSDIFVGKVFFLKHGNNIWFVLLGSVFIILYVLIFI